MSVFTVIVDIEHEGSQLPGFPITRRFEDITGESKIIDQVFPDVQAIDPPTQAGSLSPMTALWFEGQVLAELFTSYSGLFPFLVGPDGVLILMTSDGMGFRPDPHTRVRGIA